MDHPKFDPESGWLIKWMTIFCSVRNNYDILSIEIIKKINQSVMMIKSAQYEK